MDLSEIKYHSLFEQASDPIMITDFKGNFIDVNTTMCNMFGYSKEELLKKNIASLIDPEQLKISPIRFDLLAEGQHIFTHRTMLHRNGKAIEVQANVKKIGNDLVMAIARDVTEIKKAETLLKAHERQLRLFVEQNPMAIAMFDKDMRYLNVSHKWLSDYNATETQLIGRIHYELYPWIPQRWRDVHSRGLTGVTEKSHEDFYIKDDGSKEWLRWEVHPWHNASGEIGGIIMLTEFITERKQMELQLKEAELKFRDLVEKSLVGVYILQNGKYAYVNPRFAEIFGYQQDDLIDSVPLETVVDSRDSSTVLENIRARIEGEMDSVHYELRGRKKTGEQIWVEVFGSRTMYKGSLAIIGTLIDITDRKSVAAENERMRYMLNERVKELTTLYRFGQVLQAEQSSMEELLEKLVTVLPPGWQYPDITAARICFGKTIYKTPNFTRGLHKQDVSFKTPDGTVVKMEVIYLEKKPVAAEGAFLAEERHLINMLAEMFGIYLARKEESEALKKSEANLQTIINTTDTIYILLDEKLRIISFNKRAVDFVSAEFFRQIKVNDRIVDYFPGKRRSIIIKQLKRVLAGEQVNYETQFPQTDHSIHWYDVKIQNIKSQEGELFGVILAILDITEKKSLEAEILEQKVQEQKKISRAIIHAQEKERNHIGQELHDNVNQILAGTKLYMRLAAQGNESVEEIIKYPMELIDSSINEIRKLSSRHVTPEKKVKLKELISSLLDTLSKNAGLKTSLEYNTSGAVIGDDIKLNIYRIIQEQLNNITKYASAKAVKVSVTARNGTIGISITDDGVGFNVNKKRKGIGISNMINRVEAFNGQVSIESLPGKGTTVTAIIPVETNAIK